MGGAHRLAWYSAHLVVLQVTIRLARDMCPKKIVGIDIDPKLVNTAWKNLHRY